MGQELLPFNIDLLILDNSEVKGLLPVKVLDIFISSSRNYHPDGLFSTEIFGRPGEERRNRLYSYIPLHIEIFHPTLFKSVCDLKSLYDEIIHGKSFAVFDPKLKDFVKSDIAEGQTGFTFFLEHFKKLDFAINDSPKRQTNIKLINKYRDKAFISNFIVMPAGLRDYVIDDNGKPSEDEINGLYRKIISISSMIGNVKNSVNKEYLDNIRINLQNAVQAVYLYIKNMMEGKNKLILGKWAGRKVYDSTRNVITTNIPKVTSLDDVRRVGSNQTTIGLYQYLRMTLPLTVKNVRDTYLSNVFVGSNAPSVLVNKKTLKRELVQVDPDYYDEWMTYEGIEKICARYGREHLRHEHLTVGDDHFIGLIFKGRDGTFKFMQDIDDLPDKYKDERDSIHPITFTELMYLSVQKGSDDIPVFITRYPVAAYGGIYPSLAYVMTTVISEVRSELGDDWEVNGVVAKEFPIPGENFYNSMSPNIKNIKKLVADYDKIF